MARTKKQGRVAHPEETSAPAKLMRTLSPNDEESAVAVAHPEAASTPAAVAVAVETTYTVVEMVQRSEDAEEDIWIDICLELLPKDKAVALSRMLELFDKSGVKMKGHVQVWPVKTYACDCDQALTEDEVKEMQAFDIDHYDGYSLEPRAPCIIAGRYMVRSY